MAPHSLAFQKSWSRRNEAADVDKDVVSLAFQKSWSRRNSKAR